MLPYLSVDIVMGELYHAVMKGWRSFFLCVFVWKKVIEVLQLYIHVLPGKECEHVKVAEKTEALLTHRAPSDLQERERVQESVVGTAPRGDCAVACVLILSCL